MFIPIVQRYYLIEMVSLRMSALSFLKKNGIKILVPILLITSIVPSVMLYFTNLNYYYEQNMSRYAMGQAYEDVRGKFYWFATFIDIPAGLEDAINQSASMMDNAQILQYMDPANDLTWYHFYQICENLWTLNQRHLFVNSIGGSLHARARSCILDLNDTLFTAQLSNGYTVNVGPWIYKPNANQFELNQTKIMEIDEIYKQFFNQD